MAWVVWSTLTWIPLRNLTNPAPSHSCSSLIVRSQSSPFPGSSEHQWTLDTPNNRTEVSEASTVCVCRARNKLLHTQLTVQSGKHITLYTTYSIQILPYMQIALYTAYFLLRRVLCTLLTLYTVCSVHMYTGYSVYMLLYTQIILYTDYSLHRLLCTQITLCTGCSVHRLPCK